MLPVGDLVAFGHVASSLIGYIPEAIVSTVRGLSRLYDVALPWRPLLATQPDFFLQIFDIPFPTGEPTRPLLTVGNNEKTEHDIYHAIGAVPAQEERSFRVYFAENFDFQKFLPGAISPLTESASITSQWSSISERTHWEIDSYKLTLKPMLRDFFNGSYIDSVSIAAGTVRMIMKCMFHSLEDGRVIWYINVTSMVQDLDLLFTPRHLKRYELIKPTPHCVCEHHLHFCERLRTLIEAHSNLSAHLRSTSGHKQLLLLFYIHAVMDGYCLEVYRLQADYARKKEGLSDPRRAKLSISMLAEITQDACFYEEVKESIGNLAGAIDTLTESLKLQLGDTTDFRQFQSLAIDLQSTCTDLTRIMTSLSATLDNHLRLFEISRGVHDAQKVGLLSILASVFLPLSLATGLLSMQTRFVDLHYLLFDFFGVLVILGSIVIFILVILRTHLWWKELLLQLNRNSTFRKHIRPAGSIISLCFFLLVWALLLSSFLIGMIKDVGLGLKVLGYGIASAIGIVTPIPLVVFVLAIGIYMVRLKTGRKRKVPNRSQPEA